MDTSNTFVMDGLSHIHSNLTSHWIVELDDHVRHSRNFAYNEGLDKTEYRAWQTIKSLDKTISDLKAEIV
jgi:hypothetical protein